MAVEGRLTKKKMIDNASLFKQRRSSIGLGAGSRSAQAGERALKVARARRRRLSALPSAPPPRSAARTLAGRVTTRRCTTANKPALAGPREIKNKTNKLAKRPESWGGASAAARRRPGNLGPGAEELRWQARHRSRLRPPGLCPRNPGPEPVSSEVCWRLVGASVASSTHLHSPRWE